MVAQRLRASFTDREAGIGLVEVLVAMMIFAMLATGIAYALTSTLSIARDSKARQVAANLAAEEIDDVRTIGDPFKVFTATRTVTPASGGTYTVRRTTAWATPTGADQTCGTSGGALQYKRVTVKVTWNSPRSSTSAVYSDTLLAPSKRINDPTKGTLLVSVKDVFGVGAPNISFTVTSSAGTIAASPTDADGCSFILGAAPGDYTVKLNTTGYVDFAQKAQPTIVATVSAGSSAAFPFQYDKAAAYTVNYASNSAPAPKVPTDLVTTFVNNWGVYPIAVGGTVASLHPYKEGYQAFAGAYAPDTGTVVGCESVDPEAWDPDTRVTPALVGARAPAVAAPPAGAATLKAPMGVVNVSAALLNPYLIAVSQPDVLVPGQPACVNTMTYNYGAVIPALAIGSVRVALPFGSWKLYSAATATGTRTLLTNSRVTLVTGGRPADSNGLFALDPRGIVP